MAIPTSQTLLDGDEQEKLPEDSQKSESPPPDDLDSHYSRTPIKFLPLRHVYSTTSPCSGSANVVSKKVSAQLIDASLLRGEQFQAEEDLDEFDKVYSRCKEERPLFDALADKLELKKDEEARNEVADVVVVLEEDEGSVSEEARVLSKKRRVGSSEREGLGGGLEFEGKKDRLELRNEVPDVVVVLEEDEGSGRADEDEETVVLNKKRRVEKLGGGSKSEAKKNQLEHRNEEVVVLEEEEEEVEEVVLSKKRRVEKSGGGSKVNCAVYGRGLRGARFQYNVGKKKKLGNKRRRKNGPSLVDGSNGDDCRVKKWFQLNLDGADPMAFNGLKCKVYWPLDNAWYKASITSYDPESKCHNLKYEDGDEEELMLSDEQIKFHISKEEMQKLNLRGSTCLNDDPDYSQLIGLAATFDESRELEPGDIIWAKLTGHAMWPAVIMDESLVSDRKGLNKKSGGKSVPVQFFGTHDFARIQVKQIVSFVKGLVSCFHLKCKTSRFLRSLKEAKIYLNEQKLPKSMLNMQQACADGQIIDSDETLQKNEDSSNMNFSTMSSAYKLSERYQNMPNNYRPVRIGWKDLDRCNVCHMDEEYENNLFLQCDKCRMMVHCRCYGEEFVEGILWLCNLCKIGAPEKAPPCRLCPIVGGAMKPTTDGHWAHLACAIWIPETCLSDIKKMEPIDGLSRINKDRWKLLCSICGVAYGACIQCSNNSCRVAYHPLCARAAGLCVELEDEDRLHLIPVDDNEEEQCIRLLSFCKKHKQPSNDRPAAAERRAKRTLDNSSVELYNKSGCARCEPYDYSARRGRKAPEILAAASAKRLFMENRPYVVGGYSQHDSLARIEDKVCRGSKFSSEVLNKAFNQGASQNIHSMADKYKYMKETVKKRLTFGKSRIHGFGIFAKQPHKAGDMVIEYTGEIVRQSVADRREHLIYNSLVGAGTYMFRIDDDRVLDATRVGSIAHLINHSCEPNCHSRVITVSGDKHIIIFAKRDIERWEELTYDYRFFSIDERLPCYCGFKNCRGVVNDIEAEEQAAKLCVPRSELVEWKGE